MSADGARSVVNLVVQNPEPFAKVPHVCLRGLEPEARYLLEEEQIVVTGAALMYAGYSFPRMLGDYPAAQLHLIRQDGECDAP